MWIYNECMGMETFVLHGLILYVSEGLLSVLLCIHNVGMETLDLHELIADDSEDVLYLMFCSHIVNIHVFWAPY